MIFKRFWETAVLGIGSEQYLMPYSPLNYEFIRFPAFLDFRA